MPTDSRDLLGERTGQLFVAHQSTVVEAANGDARPGTKLTSEHLFQGWCLTKPLLALVAHELHVRRVIDLAESLRVVGRWFPGMADANGTFLDALCHDAGLAEPKASQFVFSSPTARSSLVSKIAATAPSASYSELSAWLLVQWLIEQTTHETANGLINRMVLEPLGLEDSAFLGMDRHTYRVERDRIATYWSTRRGVDMPWLHDMTESFAGMSSPCLGGYITAGSIGRVFLALLRLHNDGVSPVQIGSEALRTSLEYRRGREYDAVLERDCDFSAGFTVDLQHHGFGHRVSPSAFGYIGWLGASFVMADPEFDLVVARICPRIQTDFKAVTGERGQFVDQLYEKIVGSATDTERVAL